MKIQMPMITTFLLLTAFVSFSQAQTHPLEPFWGSWTVKSSTFGTTEAEVSYTPVAGGQGVLAVWRQREEDSYYEAQALMGYDAETEEVRVFEVNTQGVTAFQLGHFDESGTLTVERRSSDGAKVLECRVFEWPDKNTLKMSAVFYSDSDSVQHSVTMVRE